MPNAKANQPVVVRLRGGSRHGVDFEHWATGHVDEPERRVTFGFHEVGLSGWGREDTES